VAPQCTLVCGFVPVEGQDQTFPGGFVIKAEKCPNRRGVERILEHFGAPTTDWKSFVAAAGEGRFAAAYITGGYGRPWLAAEDAERIARVPTLIVHDLLPGPLDDRATLRLPAAAWTEREGVWMNCDGLVQRFERAVPPPDGVKAEGQFFYELCGQPGLYRSTRVCAAMAETMPEFAEVFEPRELPKHAH